MAEPSPLDDREYKHREDLIDACLAAWTALLWHHRSGLRCQVLGRDDPLVDDGGRRATIIAPIRRKIPPGGSLEVPMAEEFVLEARDRGTDHWWDWGELRSEWFQRADDGSYVCTDHGGPPIYIRALAIDDVGIIDHVDADGYGDVSQLRLVTGTAYAGSQLQTQLYVNRRTHQLDDAIREEFTDLRTATIEWRSPLTVDNYREYWDKAFLRQLDLERYEPELAAFWPTGGPHWDALGVVHRPGERRPGVLLVEGKSYPKELFGSGTAAKLGSESRKLIEQSLGWTQRQLAVTTKTPEDWCGRLYQSANRLAHLCWLQSLGVSAWLVHLLLQRTGISAPARLSGAEQLSKPTSNSGSAPASRTLGT